MSEEKRCKLIAFREIGNALSRQYMSHNKRQSQAITLWGMIKREQNKLAECNYRNTLDALCEILTYVTVKTRDNELTHTGAKSALQMFVTVCQQAINDSEWLYSVALLSEITEEAEADEDRIPF